MTEADQSPEQFNDSEADNKAADAVKTAVRSYLDAPKTLAEALADAPRKIMVQATVEAMQHLNIARHIQFFNEEDERLDEARAQAVCEALMGFLSGAELEQVHQKYFEWLAKQDKHHMF